MTKFNRSYEDLVVWQKAIGLAEIIYQVTKRFPKEEMYGIISQLRRCAISVASNIAEGAARNSSKEFQQFLSIASGSCAELKTQIIISSRIGYMDAEASSKIVEQIVEIERMISGLNNSLATRNLQLATSS